MDTILMNSFYNAFKFLSKHPMFVPENEYFFPSIDRFLSCLYIEVVKVDPKTKSTDLKDESNNTAVRVWLECGPYGSHDLRLDCGGENFEEAIIILADRVREYYGDYPESIYKRNSQQASKNSSVQNVKDAIAERRHPKADVLNDVGIIGLGDEPN